MPTLSNERGRRLSRSGPPNVRERRNNILFLMIPAFAIFLAASCRARETAVNGCSWV
jgi:hypothetical protein